MGLVTIVRGNMQHPSNNKPNNHLAGQTKILREPSAPDRSYATLFKLLIQGWVTKQPTAFYFTLVNELSFSKS